MFHFWSKYAPSWNWTEDSTGASMNVHLNLTHALTHSATTAGLDLNLFCVVMPSSIRLQELNEQKGWKQPQKVFWPAFGCVQHPKAGRNTHLWMLWQDAQIKFLMILYCWTVLIDSLSLGQHDHCVHPPFKNKFFRFLFSFSFKFFLLNYPFYEG